MNQRLKPTLASAGENSEGSKVPDGVVKPSPYLFIPVSAEDNGSRPTDAVGWADSPAILFVNEAGQIEFTVKSGAYYRILLLIRNSGSAPIYSGIAEFYEGYGEKSCYLGRG